jgi:hypothetical protein
VFSNGCGWGTRTAGGASFGCNWLEQSGNTYKTKGCYLMILIMKKLSPTIAPTMAPTEPPTIKPTNKPSLEPTQNPTSSEIIPAPFSIGNVKICPFIFIKKADEAESLGGCALISVSVLNDLKVNANAFSAYICGGGQIMLNDNSLMQAGFLDAQKKSYISDIIPGSQTSVTFFLRNDFNGTKYTFTSGFHPYLTKINLPDGAIVKSLIYKSTVAPDMNLPKECQS